jgi:putative membrane protein
MLWCSTHGWGWGGSVAMAIGMVAFWALVITAVVLVVRYLANAERAEADRPAAGGGWAEDLLAQRFARGEIDEDEFRGRLTLLREGS